MPDETPSEILGSLPRRRPQRRSDKRDQAADASDRPKAQATASDRPKAQATAPARPKARRQARQQRPRAEALRQPQQPSGTPPAPGPRRPIPASGTELLSTVAQATAELAEIGLSVSARALRSALRRLPRP